MIQINHSRKRVISAVLAFLTVSSCMQLDVLATAIPQSTPAETPATAAYVVGPLAPKVQTYTDESGLQCTDVTISNLLDANTLSEIDVEAMLPEDETLPEAFDLRTRGYVSTVKNQGDFGTCWSHSALSSLESQLLQTNDDVELSELHLAYYTYFEEILSGTDLTTVLNFGGNIQMAMRTLSRWEGPVLESRVPYTTFDFSAQSADAILELQTEADYHLQDAYFTSNSTGDVLSYPNDSMKALIYQNNAIDFSFYCAMEYYNADTAAYYCDDTGMFANHAVSVVGWDDNYAKENFKEGIQPSADGAWLIKNSWGTDFGKDGYMWISYEDVTQVDFACYFLEANDNYQEQFCYDENSWNVSIAPGNAPSTSAYAANIFTAQENTNVCAASFFTTDNNASYEITVYTNLTDKTNPTSGTASVVTAGSEQFAGYHTIDLTEAVAVEADSLYAITVKLTNPVYEYPLAMEGTVLNKSAEEDITENPEYLSLLEETGENESFISENGEAWIQTRGAFLDYSENYNLDEINQELISYGMEPYESISVYLGNACIRAFTNTDDVVSFSEMEGNILCGITELTLSNAAGKEIRYSIDDGELQLYTEPILLTDACTVSAATYTNDIAGNCYTKTYTQTPASISSLVISSANADDSLVSDMSEPFAYVDAEVSEIQISANTAAQLSINGKSYAGGTPCEPISLAFGENSIALEATADGMITTTYLLTVYRPYYKLDYINQTLYFDEAFCSIETEDGTLLTNGAPLLDLQDTMLTITILDTAESYTDLVYPAPVLSEDIYIANYARQLTNDFTNDEMRYSLDGGETSSPASNLLSSFLEDGVAYFGYLVEPGVTYTFFLPATEYSFASNVVTFTAPQRPDAPIDAYTLLEPITDTSITLLPQDNVEFSISETIVMDEAAQEDLLLEIMASMDFETKEEAIAFLCEEFDCETFEEVIAYISLPDFADWTDTPSFSNLIPGTTYSIAARYKATDTAFNSEYICVDFTTTGTRPLIIIDYYSECLEYDETVVFVTNMDGSSTINPYDPGILYQYCGQTLLVTNLETGEVTELEIPARPDAPAYTIDYLNQATYEVIDEGIICASYPLDETVFDYQQYTYEDLLGYLNADGTLDLTNFLGYTLEFYYLPTQTSFASEVTILELPMSEQSIITVINYTYADGTLTIEPIAGAEYAVLGCNSDAESLVWSNQTVYDNLDTTLTYYTIYIRYAATETTFAGPIFEEILYLNNPNLPFGDLNEDGEINANDAVIVLRADARSLAGLDNGLTETQSYNADVNGDGLCDCIDASYILQYAAEDLVHEEIIFWPDILS